MDNIATTSHTLTGLASATAYNFRVRTNCASTNSTNTATVAFTTAASTGCSDPSEPNDTQATAPVLTPTVPLARLIATSTDLDWFKFANSSTLKNIRVRLTNLPADYNVRLYNSSTQVGISNLTGTANETIILNNATVSSAYYVRVNGASGVFNATQCYTVIIETSATAFSMPEGSPDGASIDEESVAHVTLFPNPANDLLTVIIPAHQSDVTIEVLDALGRVVRTERQGRNEAPSYTGISVADRTEGLYLVRVTMDGATNTQRLIVTR